MKTFVKQSELSAFRDSAQPHPVRNMIWNHNYIVNGFLMVHSKTVRELLSSEILIQNVIVALKTLV
jgi:hypothetical protein